MADYTENTNEETSEETSASDKVVAEAKERFALCCDHESEQRRKELDDLLFLDGEQWDEAVRNERHNSGRPALVVNRLDQFVQQITNSNAQQHIGASVSPVDDDADEDTAEVIEGKIRHIEYNSDAQLAYGTAFFYAVAVGRGYWRILTEYTDPLSFDMDFRIERLPNPHQVYLDPFHTHPSGKDAKYGFVTTQMSKEEYKREYPKSDLATCSDWDSLGANGDWFSNEHGVRIAEYYRIEEKPDTLLKLQNRDGQILTVLESKLKEAPKSFRKGVSIVAERETSTATVEWFKLNGHEVLEKTVWPTSPSYVSIPIVKVIGNELNIDGKTTLKGIIRNLKDAQRQYNFMLSAQTESIDGAKGQIVATVGAMEGHEQVWQEAHKHRVLTINDTDEAGNPIASPKRLEANQSIAHMTEARLMAADDLKALTGIYDSALGKQSNETSGIAINSRKAQSDTANFHFTNNGVRSVTHGCRIIVSALPKVLDTPRTILTMGEDQTRKTVKVNRHLEPGFVETEQDKPARLDVGRYDVVCEAGPSYSTKREQEGALVTELVKVAPEMMQWAPDLILKSVGASPALVERAKKALPPQFQDNNDEQQIPPQLKAQMDAMSQQNEQLTAELHKALDPLEKARMDNDTKLQLARIDMEKAVAIAEVNTKAQSQLEREKWLAKFEHDLQLQAGEHADAAASRTHQAELDHIADTHADARTAAMQPPPPPNGTGTSVAADGMGDAQ